MKRLYWLFIIGVVLLAVYYIGIEQYSFHNGRLYSYAEWKRECFRRVDKRCEDSLSNYSLSKKKHVGHNHSLDDTVKLR